MLIMARKVGERMPNKTIYVKDSDLPIWDRAQKELGESVSSAFIEYLKSRLENTPKRRKRSNLDMVQAMDALLAEVNAAKNLDIERHPFWSPIILDANSVNIGYKLHQKRANPDRIMSLVVHPLDFDDDGQLNSRTRDRIVAEIEKFWDGRIADRHRLVDTTGAEHMRAIDPNVLVHCVQCGNPIGPLFLPQPEGESAPRAITVGGVPVHVACPSCGHVYGYRTAGMKFHEIGTPDTRPMPIDRISVRLRRICGANGCQRTVLIHTTVKAGTPTSDLMLAPSGWSFHIFCGEGHPVGQIASAGYDCEGAE
jgi:hypothetical protein